MRSVALSLGLLLTAACCLAGVDLSKPIDRLELKDGTVLMHVQFVAYGAETVMAKWQGGMGTIRYEMLPKEVEEKARGEIPHETSKDATPPKTDGEEQIRDGWKIADIGVSVLENDSSYVHFSWKAEISNTGMAPISVRARITFTDKDHYKLDEEFSDTELIPAGRTVAITDISLMKTSLWERVTHYEVVAEKQ